MTDQLYHWCNLANGDKRTCGYIEARGAKVGSKVELLDLDRELWEVLTVGNPTPADQVHANERKFKAFQASLKGGVIA